MKLWVLLVGGIVINSVGVGAFAQTGSQPPAPSADGLEDIVVTAQKRPERLQETPLAVTAFTQRGLDAAVDRTLVEIVKQAPGVSFSSGNTARAEGVRIRGVGTASFSEGVTGSTASFSGGRRKACSNSTISNGSRYCADRRAPCSARRRRRERSISLPNAPAIRRRDRATYNMATATKSASGRPSRDRSPATPSSCGSRAITRDATAK
jgi:hypothetical protein